MRRPKWIGVLLLTLAVAAIFASLAQWQMSHAVRLDEDRHIDTETPVAVSKINKPGTPVNDSAAGHMVKVPEGEFVPDDFQVITERDNYGQTGAWLTGHFVTDNDVHYGVAIGWAPDDKQIKEAVSQADSAGLFRQQTLEGRFTPTESTKIPRPDENPHVLKSMVPGQLANLWHQPIEGVVSSGYLVLHADSSMLNTLGLHEIESVAPKPPEKINWLNLFYAIEWVVFAGFALYFWIRLARDAWEREHEELLQQRQQTATGVAENTVPKDGEHGSSTNT
jgi:cytochrome oxidase assembly protein ShyY1